MATSAFSTVLLLCGVFVHSAHHKFSHHFVRINGLFFSTVHMHFHTTHNAQNEFSHKSAPVKELINTVLYKGTHLGELAV